MDSRIKDLKIKAVQLENAEVLFLYTIKSEIDFGTITKRCKLFLRTEMHLTDRLTVRWVKSK